MKATFLRIESYKPKRTPGRSKRGVRVCFEAEGLEGLNAGGSIRTEDRPGAVYVNIHGFRGSVDVEVYHSAATEERSALLSDVELINIATEYLNTALQEHVATEAATKARKAAEHRRREVTHLADQLSNQARKDALAAIQYEARLEELTLQFEEAFHERAKELAAEARAEGITYDGGSVVVDDIVEDVASALETMLAPSPRGGLNLD